MGLLLLVSQAEMDPQMCGRWRSQPHQTEAPWGTSHRAAPWAALRFLPKSSRGEEVGGGQRALLQGRSPSSGKAWRSHCSRRGPEASAGREACGERAGRPAAGTC